MPSNDRFATRAAAYATSRPSYPPEAIQAIFEGLADPTSLVVADIGAGTGISSRLLASLGTRVFAVEPSAAMRVTAQPSPRIEWLEGSAERTTLLDRSVDIVAAFQAWHWFDRALATAEARRIARPGGKLAVVYNERDERDPFTALFGEIVRRYAFDATERWRAEALEQALGIEPSRTTRRYVVHTQALDRVGMHARATSTSYLPQTGAAATALHADIDALLDRYAITQSVHMHLITIVVCVGL